MLEYSRDVNASYLGKVLRLIFTKRGNELTGDTRKTFVSNLIDDVNSSQLGEAQ